MEEIGKRKLQRRNRWADVLAAIILCGALALGMVSLRDYMRGKLLHYATAQQGYITLTLPAEILVLRHESVVTAPAAGPFVPQVEEGARVKEGSLIGQCGGVAVYAEKGGEISYVLDGWENKLQTDALHDLDWQQLFSTLREEQAQKAENAADSAPAEELLPAQRPIARLVDNLLDYTLLLKLQDPRGLLTEDKHITFRLPQGQPITATYHERWQEAGGDVYYIFDVSPREDTLFSLRYSEAEVIVREVQGILIPSSAITVDAAGHTGVFIRKKRQLAYTEIEELTSKDGMSVVNGLDETAVVVTNPARATDGQRI